LRRELEAKGHVFKTRSDTEVIVHGYEEWGDDCVSHLNGMFGLAVWDAKKQRLLLARDHFGSSHCTIMLTAAGWRGLRRSRPCL